MRTQDSLRIVSVVCSLLLSAMSSFGQEIPAPEEFLGHQVGADYQLVTYDRSIEYLRALEEVSPRLRLFEAGKTTEGTPQYYAVITSEENMARLDRYKDISERLSLARGLTDVEARRLAAEGKAIVYIDGGLHATEVAPAQHLIELAYDLIVDEDPLVRDKTILTLLFANPDGMDMIAAWYESNLGTPYEVSPMPRLYQKYVGHDNNRDSYMLNMAEARNINAILNREWYPVVMYNHHQTAPFPTRIYIPPSAEPTNDNMHPLTIRGRNLFGTAMGLALDQEGKSGAISRVHFDLWYPGYVDEVGQHFNIISLMTETALYRYATPHFYTLDDFPEEYRGLTRSTFYPSPWTGGWWRLRDAVEYCLTASKSVLHTAALNSKDLLFNKYQMGRDNIARFEAEPPHAWIIPRAQWDPPTAALMLERVMMTGIEVFEAESDFVCDGVSYPARTWVIPMNQPFALFVKTMFEAQNAPDLSKLPSLWQGTVEPQEYPDVHVPHQDMDGWTLPYQMGVKAVPTSSSPDVPLRQLEQVSPPAGSVAGGGGTAYLISPKTNNSFIAVNRLLERGGEVLRAKEEFTSGGKKHPAGTWIVPSKSYRRSVVEALAEELSLVIDRAGSRLAIETYKIRAPRVALYKPWQASMDEGWTRWLLEEFEFPFTSVLNADVKAGSLQERFDVLVIPSMSTKAIMEGFRIGTVLPKYAGGIGRVGLRNIREFVEAGGTLVTLNSSSLFAVEQLGLPLSDALKDVGPRSRREEPRASKTPEFVCSGSILRMAFDSDHPVAYGMREEASGVFARSPAFSIHAAFEADAPVVIANYPKDELLMSGYLKGEKYLTNKASAVEAPLGSGRVLLLGFGVQHRAQPHQTFKLLFNSLYYGSIR